ncbi:MAG: ATP phosphoribosyltransferase [Dehalococcoidia bacterium]
MAQSPNIRPNGDRANDGLRLAIPSDGAMYEPTLAFLDDCGLGVKRPSARRYTATVPAIDGLEVVFQRTADITSKVEDGNADLGLVGADNFHESRIEGGDTLLVMPELGFGHCELVVAVPDSWMDVDSMADLADLAVEFRESGRELRVATKYPRLVQRFLFSHGVNYFSLASVSGTLEAAPSMGYADIIVDITASGVTLRENRLKRVGDGTVLVSEGALIGNRSLLKQYGHRLELAREIIERIEAYRVARGYLRVTANVQAESEEAVAAKVLERQEAAGLQGPTVARVYAPDGRRWFSITVYVEKDHLSKVVDHFRSIGGVSVTVAGSSYVFSQESSAYTALLAGLGLN